MRELVADKQVREPLRLIVGWGKDRGADRAVLGFAQEQAQEEIDEAVKDLGPKQRAKFEDETCDL